MTVRITKKFMSGKESGDANTYWGILNALEDPQKGWFIHKKHVFTEEESMRGFKDLELRLAEHLGSEKVFVRIVSSNEPPFYRAADRVWGHRVTVLEFTYGGETEDAPLPNCAEELIGKMRFCRKLSDGYDTDKLS